MITSSSSLISRPLSFCHDLNVSLRCVSTRSGKITFVSDNSEPLPDAPSIPVASTVPEGVPIYNQHIANPNPVLGDPMSYNDLYSIEDPAVFLNRACDLLSNSNEDFFDFLRRAVMTGGLRPIVLEKVQEIIHLRDFFLDLRSNYFRAHNLILPTNGRILIPGPVMHESIPREGLSNLSLERSLSSEFELIDDATGGGVKPKTRGFIIQSIREELTDWTYVFMCFINPSFLAIMKYVLFFYSLFKFIKKMFHFFDKFKSFFIFDQFDQNLMIGIFSIKNIQPLVFLIEKIKCVFMTFPYRIRYILRS